MNNRSTNETNLLLRELFSNPSPLVVEKKTQREFESSDAFEKNLHDCFIIRGKTARVKESKPYYGQITIDVIKKFIDTDSTTVDENLINQLSIFLSNQNPGFELVKNQIEMSDMVRFLEDSASFKGKYKFTTKYGAIRVMPLEKRKLELEVVKKMQKDFLDSLVDLSHGPGTSYKLLNAEQNKKYSGRYESAIVNNFNIPGFETFESFVITLAIGKGNATEKETQQREKLKKQLLETSDGNIIINGVSFGPYNDVVKAPGEHAKADIVFTGPGGNLYISLKDGKTPKDYQQWGGVLKDKEIMKDPRMVEFFEKCVSESAISINEERRNTFNVKLKKSMWSNIPGLSSKPNETNIELKAVYGRDALRPASPTTREAETQKIPYGENFCQFVIQSSVEGLGINKDGTLKADGKIIQWPNLPGDNYKPIFYARTDNSSAIELKDEWVAAFKRAVANVEDGQNKAELSEKLALIGKEQIKITGIRLLIYPFGKKNPGDIEVKVGENIKESRRTTLGLLDEFFAETKTNSHPSAYKAPEGSKRDKQLDQTQADLKSGDPERIQRAYKRRERMEKQARSKPGWENRPRKDTQAESIDLQEAMQVLFEALSKKLKATLRKKAEKRGLTPGSVEQEYKKGLAAYASSGSRPGMTAHQWAMARVNSANPSKKWATVKKSKSKKKK
jgi:hypothetical protein